MNRRILSAVVLGIVSYTLHAVAVQVTPYIITDFPETLVTQESHVKIAWQKASSTIPTDSGTIYYSRSPGGGDIANYDYTVENADIQNDKVGQRRQTWFYPENENNMGIGRYYCMVAWIYSSPLGVKDTFYSNELPLIIEKTEPVEITSPSQDTISQLTPTFEWTANQGVPYYHVILSDEKISIDSSEGGELDIKGISVVWQAITPNTQITYGTPDPSGTMTATPSPLSPGKTYSLVVLNNYGNNMMYTSQKFGLPKTFSIRGDTLKSPRNVYPAGEEISDDSITFTWTNLDTGANTYHVFVYKSSGDLVEGINAQLAVWDDEVGAGQFKDTGRVTINAKSILTEKHYTWKVMAVDKKGAGTSGDTTGFDYRSPTGTMELYTIERVTAGGEVVNERAVGLVEVKVEVLGGSMEKALGLYTGSSGKLSRDRPVGTYRVTGIKQGYEEATKTLSIEEGKTTTDTLFMVRPDATIYGSVLSPGGSGINAATMTAVSDKQDTVTTKTDNSGNFVISCYEGDWSLYAAKESYITSDIRDTITSFGENVDIGSIVLERVPYTLSGIVTNDNAESVLGATVKLYQSSNLVATVPSTPQSGEFSFSVQSGTYRLAASKTGFASYSSKEIEVTGSQQKNITLYPGAAEVRGNVIGRGYTNGEEVNAPITSAEIHFANSSGDTFSTSPDPTYGNYKISLRSKTSYTYWISAKGYSKMIPAATPTLLQDTTYELTDTLIRYAFFDGHVKKIDTTDNTLIPVEKAAVSLIREAGGEVITEAVSGPDGSFELRGIPDGNYTVSAGAAGLIVDSLFPAESLQVQDGKVQFASSDSTSLDIFLVTGNKTIVLHALDSEEQSLDARVKLQSPLQRTMTLPDTIDSAGAGRYTLIVDADADSFLDLSFHSFSVPDSVDTFADTINLSVLHSYADTLAVDENGEVTLSIRKKGDIVLDSAYLYYRDETQTRFKQVKCSSSTAGDSLYSAVSPPRDGSKMAYYFVVYAGNDEYGYNREVYRTYIKPSTKLSKIEIVPGAGDTAVYPDNYEIRFSFRGYYGDALIPKELDNATYEDKIKWEPRSQGGRIPGELTDASGTSAIFSAGSHSDSAQIVELVAYLTDCSETRNDCPCSTSVVFKVSPHELAYIRVTRVDQSAPNPISNSSGSKAEFSANGLSEDSVTLALTPMWSIGPSRAGSIDSTGIYSPAPGFAGRVEIIASVSDRMQGRYRQDGGEESGMRVYHSILPGSGADTVTNHNKCSILLPDSAVKKGEEGQLFIAEQKLTNPFEQGRGGVRVVSAAFDIREINGVEMPAREEDSMQIRIRIPASHARRAAKQNAGMFLARWNADSLYWDTLANSKAVVSGTDTFMTANVRHFSWYAVAAKPQKTGLVFDVAPNPFSPYVTMSSEEVADRANIDKEPPSGVQGGTWIKFKPFSTRNDRVKVWLRILTIRGEPVWSAKLLDAAVGADHYVWWDGRTLDNQKDLKEHQPDETETVYYVKGKKMCRNGRYFVLLTAKDEKKTDNKLEEIILIK